MYMYLYMCFMVCVCVGVSSLVCGRGGSGSVCVVGVRYENEEGSRFLFLKKLNSTNS